MPLFEVSASPCGNRTKLFGESTYAYYRDSERPGMIAVRDLLNGWFEEVPASEQLDLQKRFQSRIERQHRSAFFELFLHHFLLRCGFQVEFHPDMDGVPTHPDFLVIRNGAPLFYLEAIAVSDSVEEAGDQQRIAQVYDALGKLDNPDFDISIRVDGAPETSPSAKKLRYELENWLSGLDWRTIHEAYVDERYGGIPFYRFSHEGWDVLFEPVPKAEASRGSKGEQPIAMTMPMKAKVLELDKELKEAVTHKDRYGKVDIPLVVAAQVINDFQLGKIDVMDGLLGDLPFDLSGEEHPEAHHSPSGAWFSARGPKHRNISAVLAWPTIDPWTVTAVEPICVHNPCAIHPLPMDALPTTQYTVDQGRRALIEKKGLSMAEILGLAADWMPRD